MPVASPLRRRLRRSQDRLLEFPPWEGSSQLVRNRRLILIAADQERRIGIFSAMPPGSWDDPVRAQGRSIGRWLYQ